jgi:hypothetical protein
MSWAKIDKIPGFSRGKSSPKLGSLCVFNAKENNRPIGETSPNMVTLILLAVNFNLIFHL